MVQSKTITLDAETEETFETVMANYGRAVHFVVDMGGYMYRRCNGQYAGRPGSENGKTQATQQTCEPENDRAHEMQMCVKTVQNTTITLDVEA